MIRIVAAALMSMAMLVGCGGEPSPSGSAASTPDAGPKAGDAPRPSADPSSPDGSSPTETSGRQSNDEPAVEGYRRFVAAMDVMTASGGKQTRHLTKVATGVLLRGALDQAKAYRGLKLHTDAPTRILWVRMIDSGRTEVTVRSCYDPALPMDAKGRSAVRPGAPTRWQDDMRMQLVGGTWKASFTKTRATDC